MPFNPDPNSAAVELFGVIDDPLKWQETIDIADGPINMRGCARFWNTVVSKGLIPVDCDGNPDFSRIVFLLEPGLGLELSSSAIIRYRFVEVATDETH